MLNLLAHLISAYHGMACVQMDIYDCPKVEFNYYEYDSGTLAMYHMSSYTKSGKPIEPYITYYLTKIEKLSEKDMYGLVVHELSHHKDNNNFKNICETYNGFGCDQHD